MNPSTTSRPSLALLLAAIVAVHTAIGLWHGAAHVHVPVPLTGLQQAFIGVIIVLLPVVGACLLWSRWRLAAAWLITLAMLASLIFGLLNHFVLDSVDNVVSVPEHEWRHGFVFSAAMVAVSETAGTVIGAVAVWLWGRTLDVAR